MLTAVHLKENEMKEKKEEVSLEGTIKKSLLEGDRKETKKLVKEIDEMLRGP